MVITYIYHSGFCVETENYVMIFDYYKDSEPEGVIANLLNTDKPVYIFASHNHGDHFNPAIMDFKSKESKNANITIVIADEIADLDSSYAKKAVVISKGETLNLNGITVKAYGSTDSGLSFLVTADGYNIFHAGDLNNWHWNEEADEEESAGYENAYEQELDIIRNDNLEIDVLMFPVDPRLGRDYEKGAEQFVNTVKTKLFVPMHFQNDYKKANAFEIIAKKAGCSFFNIKYKGDSIVWK